MMQCPICKKPMPIKKEDISSNYKTEKKYSRILYLCKKDDVWINVEIPKS